MAIAQITRSTDRLYAALIKKSVHTRNWAYDDVNGKQTHHNTAAHKATAQMQYIHTEQFATVERHTVHEIRWRLQIKIYTLVFSSVHDRSHFQYLLKMPVNNNLMSYTFICFILTASHLLNSIMTIINKLQFKCIESELYDLSHKVLCTTNPMIDCENCIIFIISIFLFKLLVFVRLQQKKILIENFVIDEWEN